jgi:hypothetical protein
MNYPIKDSTYQHYKGNFYQVLFVSTDTETKGKLVNYQCLATGTVYSRSLESFMETINGVPRFKLYFTSLRKDTPEVDINALMKYNDLLEKLK